MPRGTDCAQFEGLPGLNKIPGNRKIQKSALLGPAKSNVTASESRS